MELNNPLLWRALQKENFFCLKKLSEFLELDAKSQKRLLHKKNFPLNLPRRLAEKMQKNDLSDPLFLQFVPLDLELEAKEGFCVSPTEDLSFSKTPKLLKKYQGRALLITTSACAMHCRFCFRQNYPYETQNKDFSKELELIEKDSSIFEIILSGGDPLSLSDRLLENLIAQIENIPHIKIIRFHTRFQIGIPERITAPFLNILEKTRLQVIFVLHVNHPLELDEDVKKSIKEIQKIGVTILSHTVLLRGVNDTIGVLKELFLTMITSGIIPYYLNQLDKVEGSGHFEVKEEEGLKLIHQLRKELPGYAIPRYIQEVPGKEYKTPLTSY